MKLNPEIERTLEDYREDLEQTVRYELSKIQAKGEDLTKLFDLLPVGVEVLLAPRWTIETSLHVAAILDLHLGFFA